MLRPASLVIVVVLFLCGGYVADSRKTVLCHFASWAAYRQSQGKFTPADIPPSLCTHLVYQFMGLNNITNTIQTRDPYADFIINRNGLGLLDEFTKIRDQSPPEDDVKLIVGVGGWEEGSIKYSNMAASTIKRLAFVDSVASFLKKHRLDGVDICWQFPTDRGGIPEDKGNFIELLKDLRLRLNEDNKLLTVTMSAKRYVIDPGYDLRSISQQVDFMHLMTYEYHGPWEMQTGINAPLKSSDEMNVEFSVNYVIQQGADPSKVLLGLPTYGHTYTLDEHAEDGQFFNIPAEAGYSSPWTRSKGLIGYNELCYELATSSGWKERWDFASSTPFAVNNKKLASYDNQKSLFEKLKLVADKGLGGVAIWTLDTDDFRGLCNQSKYPLTTAVRDHLNKNMPASDTPVSNTLTKLKVTVVSHVYGEPIQR